MKAAAMRAALRVRLQAQAVAPGLLGKAGRLVLPGALRPREALPEAARSPVRVAARDLVRVAARGRRARAARRTASFHPSAVEPCRIVRRALSARRVQSGRVAASTCRRRACVRATLTAPRERFVSRSRCLDAHRGRPLPVKPRALLILARRACAAGATGIVSCGPATMVSSARPGAFAMWVQPGSTRTAAGTRAARAKASRARRIASATSSGATRTRTGVRRSCAATVRGVAPTATSAVNPEAPTFTAAAAARTPCAAKTVSAAAAASASRARAPATTSATAARASADRAPVTSTIARRSQLERSLYLRCVRRDFRVRPFAQAQDRTRSLTRVMLSSASLRRTRT